MTIKQAQSEAVQRLDDTFEELRTLADILVQGNDKATSKTLGQMILDRIIWAEQHARKAIELAESPQEQ